MKPLVELCHRQAVGEVEPLDAAAVGSNDETVVDEIEVDAERDVVLMHSSRRQATHVDVQRDVPPVILGRCGGQLHLADDLSPELQRVFRLAPLVQRQLGKRVTQRGTPPSTNATSSTKQ